jgi:hypothetical protein
MPASERVLSTLDSTWNELIQESLVPLELQAVSLRWVLTEVEAQAPAAILLDMAQPLARNIIARLLPELPESGANYQGLVVVISDEPLDWNPAEPRALLLLPADSGPRTIALRIQEELGLRTPLHPSNIPSPLSTASPRSFQPAGMMSLPAGSLGPGSLGPGSLRATAPVAAPPSDAPPSLQPQLPRKLASLPPSAPEAFLTELVASEELKQLFVRSESQIREQLHALSSVVPAHAEDITHLEGLGLPVGRSWLQHLGVPLDAVSEAAADAVPDVVAETAPEREELAPITTSSHIATPHPLPRIAAPSQPASSAELIPPASLLFPMSPWPMVTLGAAIRGRAHGTLVLQSSAQGVSAPYQRRISLREGDLQAVSSTDPSDSFLSFLVADRRCTPDQQHSLESNGARLGSRRNPTSNATSDAATSDAAAAVALGLIHPDQILDLLHDHSLWLLCRALAPGLDAPQLLAAIGHATLDLGLTHVAHTPFNVHPPGSVAYWEVTSGVTGTSAIQGADQDANPVANQDANQLGHLNKEPGAALFVRLWRRCMSLPEEAMRAALSELGFRLRKGPQHALLPECQLSADDEASLDSRLRSQESLSAHSDTATDTRIDTDTVALCAALCVLGVYEMLPVAQRTPAQRTPDQRTPGLHAEAQAVARANAAILRQLQALQSAAAEGSYFELLGVLPTASRYEIDQRYRVLRRDLEQYRSLASTDDALLEDWQQIRSCVDEAHQILSDDRHRARYRAAIEDRATAA